MDKRIKIAIGAVVAVLLIVITVSSFTKRIDGGYEGTLVKLYGSEKGVQDASLVTGRVWYNPFTEDVYKTPLFVQTVDYPLFSINAKDGSKFDVDPTISLRVLKGQSPAIYVKYRREVKDIILGTFFNHVKEIYRIELNKYTTDELISNREKFEIAVEQKMQDLLNKEGFYLEQIQSGLTYPESIVKAINAKNETVQRSMKVENELKITEAESRKLIVAANANAEAKLIEARAEAEANKLKAQQLTTLIIQDKWITRWNGVLPTTTAGPNTSLFVMPGGKF